jgi:hypothetical protein
MMRLPTPLNKVTLESGVPNFFGRSRLGAADCRPIDVVQNTRVIHTRFG